MERNAGSGWVTIAGVGQTLTAAATFDGTAATGADLWSIATGGVTITPGTWLVHVGVSVYNAVVPDVAVAAIRNSTTNTEVPNSRGAPGMTRTDGSLTNLESRPTTISVVADTLLLPMAHPNGGSQLAFRTANMAGAPSAWISALRIR